MEEVQNINRKQKEGKKLAEMGTEVVVFAETNLGTRLAMSVYRDITSSQLIDKIEREHFSCFEDIGEIKVRALQIKKGSHLYCLSHLVPIRHFFKDFTNVWFLHINAIRLVMKETSKEKISDFSDIREKINIKVLRERKMKKREEHSNGIKFRESEIEEGSSLKFGETGTGKRLVRAINNVTPCSRRVKLSRILRHSVSNAFSFE